MSSIQSHNTAGLAKSGRRSLDRSLHIELMLYLYYTSPVTTSNSLKPDSWYYKCTANGAIKCSWVPWTGCVVVLLKQSKTHNGGWLAVRSFAWRAGAVPGVHHRVYTPHTGLYLNYNLKLKHQLILYQHFVCSCLKFIYIWNMGIGIIWVRNQRLNSPTSAMLLDNAPCLSLLTFVTWPNCSQVKSTRSMTESRQ